MEKLNAVGIIPARYHSTRLPGKPLLDLCGKPMIQWVYERAASSQLLSELLVATDDERIHEAVGLFGGKSVMTPAHFQSGTDRISWVANDLDCDIVVNIQGDEPLIEAQEIDRVINILLQDKSADMGTLVKEIRDVKLLESCDTAKVVFDQRNFALYFSRSPIPNLRNEKNREKWLEQASFYQHVGIYSYRKAVLKSFAQLEQTELEKAEMLEQLRALENGIQIKIAITESASFGVDTEADLERARILAQKTMEG